MKLHPYDIFSEDFNLELYKKSSLILDKLNKQYSTNNFMYKQSHLMKILSYGNPKGKNILDIGCGSINSMDNITNTEIFEPWLARALSHMGANVIGIDKYASGKERLFIEYKIDLREKNSLNLIKNKSIDIACMNSFLDSPSLNGNPKEVMSVLLPQLERIIKKDGIFIYEDFML